MKFSLLFLVFVYKCFQLCFSVENDDCPSLFDANNLSQTQLIQRLTHVCRYDRLERPVTYVEESGQRLPLDVYARAYIYFIQNLEAHALQFKIHALLQLRFIDPRLTFRKVATKRRQPILGEKQLRDLLWMPHIFLANERDSSILGTSEEDILTSISPDGTVIVSSRIKATLYCWMNLHKFPFDQQHCSTILESWMYNTSELVLHWEQRRPITFDPALHLTEYVIENAWANETVINADLKDLRHGAFAGNYSSLSFTVHLTREVGFYLMDYFLPSIMIVAISWVSFWLQADQAPPRITLGTSTMLTFITLASAQGKTLPKVSYIKISEVWFLGCTAFIFGSLLEFAFVNTIWRRKNNVDVKKMNSKHILRSTLSPKLPRRRKPTGRSHSFSASCSRETTTTRRLSFAQVKFDHYLTVHNFPITTITEGEPMETASSSTQEESLNNIEAYHGSNPTINSQTSNLHQNNRNNNNNNNNNANNNNSNNDNNNRRNEHLNFNNDIALVEFGGEDNNDENNNDDENNEINNHSGWTTLTPQEIAIWIDRKSRCVFPVAFLVFNAFFWIVVYVF